MHPSIHVSDDHESLSRLAADRILTAVAVKPDLLFCAAGGSTPLRTYDLLAEHCVRKPDACRGLRLIKLDEWGGLAMSDPGTCENQMQTHLVRPLGLSGDRYFGFISDASDPSGECNRISQRLALEGPIDLCVLGLGTNGHVAMNEPAQVLQPLAHVAQLADASLHHSMLAGARVRPTHGLTLGMGEILAAHEILLLVSGASKRGALARLRERALSTEFPASLLWLHSNWTVFCDREALGTLQLKP